MPQLAVSSTDIRALAFWQREGFGILARKSHPGLAGGVIVMARVIR